MIFIEKAVWVLKMTFNIFIISDMVVCLCQGVAEKHVRRAIAEGACTRRDVTRACGAGGICGGCHRTIADMIREDAPVHAVGHRHPAGASCSSVDAAPVA
ncbi:MAG: hypothetical protein RL698_686 [Pseudomonadota bacterium]|jgi:bacterioferritin-associated ferredoxin